MRLRPSLRFALAVLGVSVSAACGNGSSGSSGGGGDAGDASAADAGADQGGLGCPPVCAGDGGSSGGDASDASMTCQQLKMMIEQLQADISLCDPQMPNQCSGTTPGICCPVSVTPGTSTENFDQAVMAYKNQCMPGMCPIMCPLAPSNICNPAGGDAGSFGICQ
jgi:hypothetical protein